MKRATVQLREEAANYTLVESVPAELLTFTGTQSDIPDIAHNPRLMALVDDAAQRVPTRHDIYLGDARELDAIPDNSVHLVVTSPPYWTLKDYNPSKGQMGDIEDYDHFLHELDRVWAHCLRVLVPGGRVVCVVGDVLRSRRENGGRHTVVPLHSSIQEHCRALGFDNLAPIIWYKIGNAKYEAGGGSFLGKPYEPNAVIKNDIEYILFQRKPGGYRTVSWEARLLSVISDENYQRWFQQVWTGVTGASTKKHPAPYPLELAATRPNVQFCRRYRPRSVHGHRHDIAGRVALGPQQHWGRDRPGILRYGQNASGHRRRRPLQEHPDSGHEETVTPQPAPTRRAVRQYWRTLMSQADRESATRSGDRGRQAAAGGKQMGGFASLIADTAVQAGLPQDDIYFGQPLAEVLPGYYRATKRWDVVAVHRERLIFAIELKSQTGPSYGNNLNNRIEEAIGSSVDFWTAYREGAFGRAPRPFLGYVFAFEKSPAALRPVRIDKPHFSPMPVFEGTSYADRARILCERLVLERNYDSAWFLLMDRKGTCREPSEMLTGAGFLATIGAHVTAALATL